MVGLTLTWVANYLITHPSLFLTSSSISSTIVHSSVSIHTSSSIIAITISTSAYILIIASSISNTTISTFIISIIVCILASASFSSTSITSFVGILTSSIITITFITTSIGNVTTTTFSITTLLIFALNYEGIRAGLVDEGEGGKWLTAVVEDREDEEEVGGERKERGIIVHSRKNLKKIEYSPPILTLAN